MRSCAYRYRTGHGGESEAGSGVTGTISPSRTADPSKRAVSPSASPATAASRARSAGPRRLAAIWSNTRVLAGCRAMAAVSRSATLSVTAVASTWARSQCQAPPAGSRQRTPALCSSWRNLSANSGFPPVLWRSRSASGATFSAGLAQISEQSSTRAASPSGGSRRWRRPSPAWTGDASSASKGWPAGSSSSRKLPMISRWCPGKARSKRWIRLSVSRSAHCRSSRCRISGCRP